jgi:hypothetical protein
MVQVYALKYFLKTIVRDELILRNAFIFFPFFLILHVRLFYFKVNMTFEQKS